MRKRNAIPPLDLLVGFESAARHLSFTRAGEELYLTQSAVSRQIKELEDQLGTALFQRRHRALALTEAGQQFYAATAQVLATMRAATERLRAQTGKRSVSVTTTHSFAALWLIPRLAGFTRAHPGVDVRITAETRVQDLDRDGLDIAIRHGPASLAGPNAVRLMGEKVVPVCSPELRPAGTLSFSGYEQIIPAALAGHGVALGRSPLVKDLLASGELVAPFRSTADPARAYYAILAKRASSEAARFLEWLKEEAAKR